MGQKEQGHMINKPTNPVCRLGRLQERLTPGNTKSKSSERCHLKNPTNQSRKDNMLDSFHAHQSSGERVRNYVD